MSDAEALRARRDELQASLAEVRAQQDERARARAARLAPLTQQRDALLREVRALQQEVDALEDRAGQVTETWQHTLRDAEGARAHLRQLQRDAGAQSSG
jgi:uncharacterized coiled-coil DUF342 family protein